MVGLGVRFCPEWTYLPREVKEEKLINKMGTMIFRDNMMRRPPSPFSNTSCPSCHGRSGEDVLFA